MRIVLVGGGTGGHFYPLIAIAEALRKKDQETGSQTELFYFGPDPHNADDLNTHNIQYVYCPAGKQRRYLSILNFFDKFKVLYGTLVAIIKLFWIYPDVVMSKGGYTSVPVILAAAFLRIPIVIHESDAVAGRANLLAKRFARYIAISYDDAAQFFPPEKTALVGIPIREAYFNQIPDPFAVLGVTKDRPLIFIIGGSSGAERINTLVLDSLDELLPNFTIIHLVGKNNVTAVQETAVSRKLPTTSLEHYFVLGFLDADQMSAALSAATIVIARAGSTSIFEIALKGKPSILIPIPENISHDQRTNAFAYARSGAAAVLEEQNITDGILTAEINRILGDQALYSTMQKAASSFTTPHAAATLADTLRGIALEH